MFGAKGVWNHYTILTWFWMGHPCFLPRGRFISRNRVQRCGWWARECTWLRGRKEAWPNVKSAQSKVTCLLKCDIFCFMSMSENTGPMHSLSRTSKVWFLRILLTDLARHYCIIVVTLLRCCHFEYVNCFKCVPQSFNIWSMLWTQKWHGLHSAYSLCLWYRL